MHALWRIANKMRFRKEQGEFKTYRDAYKWAVKNITSSKVQPIKVQKPEKAYHKAKSKGKIGIKKSLHSHNDNKSNENRFTHFGL